MVRPTTKKPKSKRVSCAQKYKLQRKVREHNRKVRKETRKNGLKHKMKKDPGIPNLHPLKEELLRKAQEAKERAVTERDRAREFRKQARQQAKALQMAHLQEEAAARGQEYEALRDTVLDDAAGMSAVTENSRKAYYKEFKKVVDAADVILEVLDARDPMGCRCAHVEQAVRAAGPNKRLVLVLNKIDLVPREVVVAWLKYLRDEYPTIAFKASTQSQKSHLSQGSGSALSADGGSECRGAGTLLKLLGNYCRNKNIKTAIRVGIVGYPNVGKSSIINSLKRSKACGVGATPGLTKSAQEISLDKHVKLLDSPGIVLATGQTDEDLILRNCVKLEHIADPLLPAEAILSRCNHVQLAERYSLPGFKTPAEFLQRLALRQGKLKRGGIPDIQGAARMLLQEWNAGLISYYTVPPSVEAQPAHVEASVVAAYGDVFDIKALVMEEADTVLPALAGEEDFGAVLAVQARDDSMGGGAANSLMRPDIERAEDGMDTDAAKAELVTTVKQRLQKTQAAASAAGLVDEEDLINPQTNKARKRAAKARRKAQRRGGSAAEETLASAPAYSFSTDFGAPAEDDDGSDVDMM